MIVVSIPRILSRHRSRRCITIPIALRLRPRLSIARISLLRLRLCSLLRRLLLNHRSLIVHAKVSIILCPLSRVVRLSRLRIDGRPGARGLRSLRDRLRLTGRLLAHLSVVRSPCGGVITRSLRISVCWMRPALSRMSRPATTIVELLSVWIPVRPLCVEWKRCPRWNVADLDSNDVLCVVDLLIAAFDDEDLLVWVGRRVATQLAVSAGLRAYLLDGLAAPADDEAALVSWDVHVENVGRVAGLEMGFEFVGREKSTSLRCLLSGGNNAPKVYLRLFGGLTKYASRSHESTKSSL